IRWRYVFFRESPSVTGGIEANQLVQQLFHIKRQAKALEERMGALDELKREMDRIGETLERIEKRIQPEELRRLLDEVNEKLNRTDARDSFSPEAGAENSAPGSGQVGCRPPWRRRIFVRFPFPTEALPAIIVRGVLFYWRGGGAQSPRQALCFPKQAPWKGRMS